MWAERRTDDASARRQMAGGVEVAVSAGSIALFYDAYSARSFSAAAIDAASSFVSM